MDDKQADVAVGELLREIDDWQYGRSKPTMGLDVAHSLLRRCRAYFLSALPAEPETYWYEKFTAETRARSAQIAAIRKELDQAVILNGTQKQKIYDALEAPYNTQPKQTKSDLWTALGKWSREICRPYAELAPPQYLIDAVKAHAAPPAAEPKQPDDSRRFKWMLGKLIAGESIEFLPLPTGLPGRGNADDIRAAIDKMMGPAGPNLDNVEGAPWYADQPAAPPAAERQKKTNNVRLTGWSTHPSTEHILRGAVEVGEDEQVERIARDLERWAQDDLLRERPSYRGDFDKTGGYIAARMLRTLTAARDRAVEALRKLVDKLHAIHADDHYKGVWVSYMVHGGKYDGPTYKSELQSADAVLADQPLDSEAKRTE